MLRKLIPREIKMKSIFILLTIGTLCTLTAASGPTPDEWVLPTSSRVFNPADQNGVTYFKAANRDVLDCPSYSFKFEELKSRSDNDKIYVVPHTKILTDNVRCGKAGLNSEHILLIPSVLLLDELSARVGGVTDIYNLMQTNARFIRGWGNLISVDQLYVGVEMSDRYCGGKLMFAKNSLYIMIFAKNRTINFGPEYGYLSGTEAGIMAYHAPVGEEQSRLCVYKDSIVPHPLVTPLPSPAAFPGSDSIPSSSPNAFAGLPGFAAAPGGGSEPSPSASPSVGSPPSASPSPSTSILPSVSVLPTETPGISTPKPSSATVSPSPSPKEDGPACFPASAMAEKEDGSFVRMGDLEVGDRVRVSDSSFSPVFMFTHKESDSTNEFLDIKVASGNSISMSPGHYLFVNGEMKSASLVRVGDFLTLSSGEQVAASTVRRVFNNGLYNPQTVDGQIVVGGIIASTYTQAVHPSFAHAILAPLRFLHRAGLLPNLGLLHRGNYGLSLVAPVGSATC